MSWLLRFLWSAYSSSRSMYEPTALPLFALDLERDRRCVLFPTDRRNRKVGPKVLCAEVAELEEALETTP